MDKSKKNPKILSERTIRNEEIFCSLLFDSANRTLRVVDFRGGNFQAKHDFLEQVLVSEGIRKVFTLIEQSDMSGWQRVGYSREGSIPGYYKRSDAYVMSKIYDEDYEPSQAKDEEQVELLTEIKNQAKTLTGQKLPTVQVLEVIEEGAVEAIQTEAKRLAAKSKSKKSTGEVDFEDLVPVFHQFSRETEDYHYIIKNNRTKQANIVGAEYQDCFGNCKINFFFDCKSRTDQNLSRAGLEQIAEMLLDKGAVSLFALVPKNNMGQNIVFAACGFRNTGWLINQKLDKKGPTDMILWNRKLI